MGASGEWDRYQIAGPGTAAADGTIAAVSRFPDNIEVWWTGPDQDTYGAFWYDDDHGWRGPNLIPGPGPATAGGMAAASRIDTSMEAWWIGADTSVRGAFWYDDGNGWQAYRDPVALPTAAAPSSGMASVSRIDTSMEIWWIGSGGTVQGAFWYQDQNNDAWQRYSLSDPGTASELSGIAAVSRIPTAMEIWWVGAQGSVEAGYWYADAGKPWQRYQLAVDGSAAASHGIAAVSRSATHMAVVWITPQGGVHGASWTEGGDWTPFPAAIAADGSAAPDGGVAAVSSDPTGLEVYWIGTDGSVRGAAWTETAGWQALPDPVAPAGSAATTGAITAMSRTAGVTEVCWIGADGSVQLAERGVTAGPVSFRILRPDDMVDLSCTAAGCRLLLAPGARELPVTYVVQPGDTLSAIAFRFYGDPQDFQLIADANHLPDPDVIDDGQQLTLPAPADPPPSVRRLLAVQDDAHLLVGFGVQHIYEEAVVDTVPPAAPAVPPPVADARAADPSRVVFELPAGTGFTFTVSGVLTGLVGLGLRVAPLAVPRVDSDNPRPASAKVSPAAPAADVTAIEAPYRLVVSPDGRYGAFTHAAEVVAAEYDSNRVELWHTRLGVRVPDNGTFRVDEHDDAHRTVRPIWTRDKDDLAGAATFTGSFKPGNRQSLVDEAADPMQGVEPEPFSVDRLYLSSLGAWLDWHGAWDPEDAVSAYRHKARLGRDQYVRIETPVYLFPFGHRGTLVTITERRIDPKATNSAAYLHQRNFIVLRQHTLYYGRAGDPVERVKPDMGVPNNFPFVSVTVDPVVSPDLNEVDGSVPSVPSVGVEPHRVSYQWKITAVDHTGRQIAMTTPLVAVPVRPSPPPPPTADSPLTTWIAHANGLIDLADAEVAFAPEIRTGDTTSRVKQIELTGTANIGTSPDAQKPFGTTSTPAMYQAFITIPALAALNRGGDTSPVTYRQDYIDHGFPDGDPAELYLMISQTEPTALDFAGDSDRGGGFVQPSVGVRALSRAHGAVGDDGSSAGGITAGKFDPTQFLKGVMPKLFGLIELTEILDVTGVNSTLAAAPKLAADQLGFAKTVSDEYGNLTSALQNAAAMLQTDSNSTAPDGIKQRYTQLLAQTTQAIQALATTPVTPLTDALDKVTDASSPAVAEANAKARDIQKALNNNLPALLQSPDLAAFLRSQIQRSYQALDSVLTTAAGAADSLFSALGAAVQKGAIHYDWYPTITGWPPDAPDADHYVFRPNDTSKGLAISVDVRTDKDGKPQAEVAAQLHDFSLQLMPGGLLMRMDFGRVGFRVGTGGKPEVDVIFNGMHFIGALSFIEDLRRIIPLDGFSDPPYVDVSPAGATAGFDLPLPSLAIGVFTLANISIGADCRVPFLGDAVTVGFNFCSKEAPFQLTVMAIGGGGWVGIRLSPSKLVLLEMGLEAGAALAINLGVASGSVSVMVGVYLRLEDDKGQLTAYFRIRGEVEVLAIASASITLELSLTYDDSGDSTDLIGRASLSIEVEIAFFSTSVELTCEKRLAGSKKDPSLRDVLPPGDGGQDKWNQYFSSFTIGA
jgi:nucleoid-associated protein YgaU